MAGNYPSEGSRKIPKGAKGARAHVCTLPHSSHNSLTYRKPKAYSEPVAKKEATGFGDLNKVRRTSAARRLFFVRMPLHVSLNERALVGIPSGMPDASFSGSPTLPCACSPVWRRNAGLPPKEAIMPSTISPANQSEQIRRLAGIADTIGALLGVYALIPADGRTDSLAVSVSLANDLAQALNAIVGGAA